MSVVARAGDLCGLANESVVLRQERLVGEQRLQQSSSARGHGREHSAANPFVGRITPRDPRQCGQCLFVVQAAETQGRLEADARRGVIGERGELRPNGG